MRIPKLVYTFVAALTLVSCNVVELTASDFQEKVINSGQSTFVKFYAPWCGHCKKLAPTWKTLAEDLDGSSKAQIAKLDCTAHQSVCTKYGVTGYPTLKYFENGSDEAKDYQGGRSLDALKSFVKEKLDSGCDIKDLSSCEEKEVKYVEKMRAKGKDKIVAEVKRLGGMSSSKMSADLKQWLAVRKQLLSQLVKENFSELN
eukprot:snap_masked-scaffold_9-processed-gene-0.9-mRNA-1 protein AED:0.35 eAED:0.36 QI:0/-1/0/1/-1/1/1/0/200